MKKRNQQRLKVGTARRAVRARKAGAFRALQKIAVVWRSQHALSNRLMQRSLLIDWFARPDIASQAMAAECAESLLIEHDARPGLGSPLHAGQRKSNQIKPASGAEQ